MVRHLLLVLTTLMLSSFGLHAYGQGHEPPPADAFDSATNFLACRGNGYALCYYSGPAAEQPTQPGTSSPPLPCNPNLDDTATCTCYALPGGMHDGELTWNYVEIGSILNESVRHDTMELCHEDGSNCLNMKNQRDICQDVDGVIAEAEQCQMAPVCAALGNPAAGVPQTLYPELDTAVLISTFSFVYSDVHEFGSTDCTQIENPTYAGCMTAPCQEDENGLTTCDCPVVDGPYQVGQAYAELQCDISPNIWSAAYHEPSDSESED